LMLCVYIPAKPAVCAPDKRITISNKQQHFRQQLTK